MLVGEREQFEQARRLGPKEIVAGNGEPPALDHEAIQFAR